ncbi:MAG: hypothetical protein RL693_1652 [Verrucomicrobiota bacterium]
MRLMFRLLVGMLILTLIAIGCEFMAPESASPIELEPQTSAAMKKEVHKVPADVVWSGPSLGELRVLHDSFENSKAPHSSSLETLVQPGESIVTEPYEGKPGEYVFSQLTPVIKTRSDDATIVEVKVNSFSVTVSGEQHPILSSVFEIDSGSNRFKGSPDNDARYSAGYTIDVSALVEGIPPMVKLTVEGSYEIYETTTKIVRWAPPKKLGADDFMRFIIWISAFAVLLPVIAIVWQLRPTEEESSVKSDTKPNE